MLRRIILLTDENSKKMKSYTEKYSAKKAEIVRMAVDEFLEKEGF